MLLQSAFMSAAKTFGKRWKRSKSVYKWYPYGETLLDDRDLPEMNKDGRAAKCNCTARLFYYAQSKVLKNQAKAPGNGKRKAKLGRRFSAAFV